MKVTEIWRYPVKTMAGEKLQRAFIDPLGIEGDRVVHVEDAQARVITSRSHPRFLALKSTLGAMANPWWMADGGTGLRFPPKLKISSGLAPSWYVLTVPSASTCCRY